MADVSERAGELPNVLVFWRSLLQGSSKAKSKQKISGLSVVEYLKDVLEKRENEVDAMIALNCLSLLCHEDEDMKKKVIRSGILNSLNSMLAPLVLGDMPTLASKRESLVKHEETVQLIMKLCHFSGEKLYRDFVTSSALDYIADLCNEYSYTEKHSQCCSINCEDNSKEYLEKYLSGKRLVGQCLKVSRPENLKSLLSEIQCYDVDILLPDKKISLNQMCTADGILWNDESSFMEKDDPRRFSSDITATKILDGGWFFAHVGSTVVLDTIKSLEADLATLMSNNPNPIVDANVQNIICLCCGNGKNARGEIISLSEKTASVFLLDYGLTIQVTLEQLFQLPERLASIRPQIYCCHLSGLRSMPARLKLLEFCSGVLCNMTSHVSRYRPLFLHHNIPDCLVRWCSLPERRVVVNAMGAMLNLSSNTLFKPTLGFSGCCQVCIKTMMRYKEDHDILKLTLSCLSNLVAENVVNRLRVARLDGLPKLVHIYHKSDDGDVRMLCLKVLRSLVNDAWELLHSPFLPDLRSVKTSMEVGDCSYNLSFRRSNQEGSLQQDTVSQLPAVEQENVSLSLQQFLALQEKRHGVSTIVANGMCEDNVNDRHFVFLDWVPVKPQMQYDFIHAACLKDLRVGTLSSRLCALLNCQRQAVIFVGIGSGGVVAGISMTRKQRDSTRLAIDSLLLEFSPRVKHSSVRVEFVPVVVKDSSNSGPAEAESTTKLSHFEERYVLEIKLHPTPGILYTTMNGKCYVFVDGKAVQHTAQQIREAVLEEVESKYKSEILVLRKAIASVKQRQKTEATGTRYIED